MTVRDTNLEALARREFDVGIVGGGINGAVSAAALCSHGAKVALIDRGDFVKVFLTQRQFLPNESRRRVGRWSRGIENIFETVIRAGQRTGEFRDHLNPRLTTLAILGMANAVPSWYSKEKASIERIGSEFAALVLEGLMSRASAPRRRG